MSEALQSKTFQIGTEKYVTTQLDAVTGRRIFLRLVMAVAPVLERLDVKGKSDEAKETAFMSAVASALASLDEDLLDTLCEVFGAVTRHVVKPGQEMPLDKGYFGLHFAARYVEMTKWLLECCRANGLLSFLPASSRKSSENAPTQ